MYIHEHQITYVFGQNGKREAVHACTWNDVRCSVLQCVAVCCSVLQCVAVCCSVLQCVAVCCSVLQCVAVCCSERSSTWNDVYTWAVAQENSSIHVYINLFTYVGNSTGGQQYMHIHQSEYVYGRYDTKAQGRTKRQWIYIKLLIYMHSSPWALNIWAVRYEGTRPHENLFGIQWVSNPSLEFKLCKLQSGNFEFVVQPQNARQFRLNGKSNKRVCTGSNPHSKKLLGQW